MSLKRVFGTKVISMKVVELKSIENAKINIWSHKRNQVVNRIKEQIEELEKEGYVAIGDIFEETIEPLVAGTVEYFYTQFMVKNRPD